MKRIALTAAAKELGISQPTLSGWESGRINPSIDGLIRMSKFYNVSTDFLLGLTEDKDPRPDYMQPIDSKVLPTLHETPVYMKDKGWAFVDAVEQYLKFANGEIIPFPDVNEDIFILAPTYALPNRQLNHPLTKLQISSYDEVWVEPITPDTSLQAELRGWYHVKDRFVENEVGQRFYLDFYESKWLAFACKV